MKNEKLKKNAGLITVTLTAAVVIEVAFMLALNATTSPMLIGSFIGLPGAMLLAGGKMFLRSHKKA